MWLNKLKIIDPYGEEPIIENGAIEIDAGKIKKIKPTPIQSSQSEIVDMQGKLVLPGMINLHTHLYSSLALGMPPPDIRPKNLKDILETIWWPLDRVLDKEALVASFRAGLLENLRYGTTTVFDHHSSPNLTKGVLNLLVDEAKAMGVRIAIAFETSDRNGDKIFREQLAANVRAIKAFEPDPMVLPLLGLHASFTLGDDHLMEIKQVMTDLHGTGVHIHLSEAASDELDAQERGYASVTDRLDKFALLNARSIIAHGLHLRAVDVDTLKRRSSGLAHCPSSNANNRTGLLPSESISGLKSGLGTDGMQANMLAEARYGTLLRSGSSEDKIDYLQLLFMHNPNITTKLFNYNMGKIVANHPADLVFYDYANSTEMNENNFLQHILWGLNDPTDVMTNGTFRFKDNDWQDIDAEKIRKEAEKHSKRLWKAVAKERKRD